jgi:hypothetical protein
MPLVDMLVELTFASVVLVGAFAAPVWGGALFIKHRLMEAHREQAWSPEQRLSHERR